MQVSLLLAEYAQLPKGKYEPYENRHGRYKKEVLPQNIKVTHGLGSANHVSDKGLMSRIYKELLQLNNKNNFSKWPKEKK